MRKLKSYKIISKSLPGYYNNVLHLLAYKHTMQLSAGNSDNITIRLLGNDILVLSTNTALDYVGLQVFDKETGDEIHNIFLQEYEINETLGDNALNKSGTWIMRKLLEYCY